MDPKHAPHILQFGVYEVDLAQGELRKHGRKIKLQDRPFQLLAALLERPGQVVTREELARKLWIDTLVDFDNGLNIAAKKVREALDDNATTPRYVETLPRRGYRFIAPVQARPVQAAEIEAVAGAPAAAPLPIPTAAPAAPAPSRRRRWQPVIFRVTALGVVLFLVVRIYWLVTSVRPARLLQVVQVTQSGRVEYANGVATDGSRIYFALRDGGRWSLSQVSAQGGNPQPLPVQIPRPDILDISPDRASLLISGGAGVDVDRPLWLVPTVGGSPRRLGDVSGHAGAWSPDGSHIVFARGAALFRVKSDGTDARKVVDAPGLMNWIRCGTLSGKAVLRFSVADPGPKPDTLWEAARDGTGLRRLLQDWNPPSQASDGDDSGTWAAGGKYFMFRSLRSGVASVWAMRENRTFPRAVEGPPVQLYSTPMQFGSLAPSPDGKRVYFAAGQERREFMRSGAEHRQFLPFLPDVAGRWASFSNDGRWVAYVTVPDEALWRSRVDGSERLQLTPPMFAAQQPRWSADGARIVFAGAPSGETSKVYVISPNGGAPEAVTSGQFADSDASWSPDGGSLLFARSVAPGGSGQPGLYRMDWRSRQATLLAGSEALDRPAWSPDGHYIAATSRSGTEIMLLDLRTQGWSALAAGDGLGVPFWSHDSKYLYYQEVLGSLEQPIFRVSIGTRRKERLMSSRQIPQSNAGSYLLAGLAPDDSPIATVIHANSDIYAMEVELP